MEPEANYRCRGSVMQIRCLSAVKIHVTVLNMIFVCRTDAAPGTSVGSVVQKCFYTL